MNYLITDTQMIHPGEPYCSTYDKTTNSWKTQSRKGSEPVYVDYVAMDMKNSKNLPQKVGECLLY